MGGLISSELIKFRSVRSHVIMTALAVAVPVALTALIAALVSVEDLDGEDTFNAVTGSVGITHILMAVMGALVIAAEYRFDTIRVTFTATPNRWAVLGAKLVVVVGVALVVGLVTIALDIGVASAILGGRDISFSLGDEGVPRALAGQVIVTALYGLAGFGLGALFRSPVAAIAVVVCQPVIVEPIVFGVRPGIGKWFPFNAGTALTTVSPGEDFVTSPWAGGLVLTAYCLALVVAGVVMVVTKDA